jgi:hypothetical protein
MNGFRHIRDVADLEDVGVSRNLLGRIIFFDPIEFGA